MSQKTSLSNTVLIIYTHSSRNYNLLLNILQQYRDRKILIVTFDTPLYNKKTIIDTVNILKELKLEHIIFEINEPISPFFTILRKTKCYYCKSIRYSLLRRIFGKNAEIIDLELPTEENVREALRAARENSVTLLKGSTPCENCSKEKFKSKEIVP